MYSPLKTVEASSKSCFQFQTLGVTQLLSIDQVQQAVLNNFKANRLSLLDKNPTAEPIYKDVTDGAVIRNNPVYLENHGEVLLFQIYYDDIDPGNPLGTTKGANKVAFFYWTILNLPPELRSSLSSIQLLGNVTTDLLRSNGFDVFLKPFVDVMSLFAKGVELTINGQKKIWYGILVNVSADMPGSAFAAGLKETSSALKCCRFCYGTKDEFSNIDHVSKCPMRNKLLYEREVAQLEACNSFLEREALSTEYGINEPCVLSSLSYFDPTKHFPHDIMHLIDEGVLNMECCLLLHQIILIDKLCTVNEINSEMSALKSSREYTKPPPLRIDDLKDFKKLAYSASEMASFASMLPLVLSRFCDSDTNPYFSNFLLLLEICASLKCHQFTESELCRLEYDISIHHQAFLSLYRQNCQFPITPKLHALIHIPQQIRLFGPPRYVWCYRFESKNAPFKKVMRRICNYKNIPYSMAVYHQKLLALDIAKGKNSRQFFPSSFSVYTYRANNHIPLNQYQKKHIINSFLPENARIKLASSVNMYGRKCGTGSIFLKNLPTEEFLPTFWEVADIVLDEVNSIILFIMEELCTDYYHRDSFSYVVRKSVNVKSVAVLTEKIEFTIPLHSYLLSDGNFHVIPSYYHIM